MWLPRWRAQGQQKNPENRGFSVFLVELIGIEPTASRVRWHGDGPAPKDFAGLDRQETSESVPKRPILATCSQNSKAVALVSSQLEDARREWNADRDARRLRKALLEIMGLLDG
jgi:hypothetical protein